MSQMFRLCRLFVERHANGCLLLGCIPRVGGSLSAPVLCMPRRCHIPISRACQPSLVINLRVLTVASLWSSHISAGTKIQLKMSNQVVYLRQRGMMEMRGWDRSDEEPTFVHLRHGAIACGWRHREEGGRKQVSTPLRAVRCPTPSGPSGVQPPQGRQVCPPPSGPSGVQPPQGRQVCPTPSGPSGVCNSLRAVRCVQLPQGRQVCATPSGPSGVCNPLRAVRCVHPPQGRQVCPTPSGPSGVCLSGGDSCSVWCTAQQANRRQGSCDGDVAMASRVWAPLG